MKKLLIYIANIIFIFPLAAFAASGSKGVGCNGKLDVSGSSAQVYKFTPSNLLAGLHYAGAAQMMFGPGGGYACLGLGLSGVSSQLKYRYHDTLEDARSVAITQLGVGLVVSGEFHLWRLMKSLQTLRISPFIGGEVGFGLANNSLATDRTDDALTTKQNGRYYHYGLRFGLRAQLFSRFGMHVGVLQGSHVYTFSGKSMSYQMLRYDAGVSMAVGK